MLGCDQPSDWTWAPWLGPVAYRPPASSGWLCGAAAWWVCVHPQRGGGGGILPARAGWDTPPMRLHETLARVNGEGIAKSRAYLKGTSSSCWSHLPSSKGPGMVTMMFCHRVSLGRYNRGTEVSGKYSSWRSNSSLWALSLTFCLEVYHMASRPPRSVPTRGNQEAPFAPLGTGPCRAEADSLLEGFWLCGLPRPLLNRRHACGASRVAFLRWLGAAALIATADVLDAPSLEPVEEGLQCGAGHCADLVPDDHTGNEFLSHPFRGPVRLAAPSEEAVIGLGLDTPWPAFLFGSGLPRPLRNSRHACRASRVAFLRQWGAAASDCHSRCPGLPVPRASRGRFAEWGRALCRPRLRWSHGEQISVPSFQASSPFGRSSGRSCDRSGPGRPWPAFLWPGDGSGWRRGGFWYGRARSLAWFCRCPPRRWTPDGVEAVENCGEWVGVLIEHTVDSNQYPRACVPSDLDAPPPTPPPGPSFA